MDAPFVAFKIASMVVHYKATLRRHYVMLIFYDNIVLCGVSLLKFRGLPGIPKMYWLSHTLHFVASSRIKGSNGLRNHLTHARSSIGWLCSRTTCIRSRAALMLWRITMHQWHFVDIAFSRLLALLSYYFHSSENSTSCSSSSSSVMEVWEQLC